jgi:hypothetical protein
MLDESYNIVAGKASRNPIIVRADEDYHICGIFVLWEKIFRKITT